MSEIKVTRSATRPLGRREAGKAAKRARILDAAEKRLREQGYDDMTMAQVAHDADVAIGTVFSYAATKAELLMMVTAQRWAGTVPQVIGEHADEDPMVAIRSLLQPVVDTSKLEPQTCAAIARELMFGTGGPHQRDVMALVAELEQAIAGIIRGENPGADGEAGARLVVSGGLIEVNRARTGRARHDDLEERIAEMIRVVLHGA